MEGEVTFQYFIDGTYRASQPIGSIFGAKVDGECSGVGGTKEEALEALKKEQKAFCDGLWS